MERSFDFGQDAVFRDLETGEQINTQPWHIRDEYRGAVTRFIDYYKKFCREHQIDFVPLTTAQHYDLALFEYLKKRKKIGG